MDENIIIEETIDDNIVLPSEEAKPEFTTMEELQAAYNALKASTEVKTTEATAEVSTDALEDFSARFKANEGSFSEKDYEELAAKGYSKDFLDTYVAGVKATEMAKFEELLKDLGTIEDYTEAFVFAQNNWTEEQIVAYNEAINTSSEAVRKIVIGALIKESKMAANKPIKENEPILELSRPKGTVEGYATKAERDKDMRDPRYGKDAAYSAKVAAKVMLTDESKWNQGVYKGV